MKLLLTTVFFLFLDSVSLWSIELEQINFWLDKIGDDGAPFSPEQEVRFFNDDGRGVLGDNLMYVVHSPAQGGKTSKL